MKAPLLLLSAVESNEEGRLAEDLRRQIGKTLRLHHGKALDIEIREHKTQRSLEQNAWIWGVAYPLLAETLGYDRDEIDDMHYALVARCFGMHRDDKLGTDVPNARSSKLTTKEFSEFMEWLVRFAAKEFNCVIPLPDEATTT